MFQKNTFTDKHKVYIAKAVEKIKQEASGTVAISILRNCLQHDKIRRRILCYEGAVMAAINKSEMPFKVGDHVEPIRNCICDVRVPGEKRNGCLITNGPIKIEGMYYFDCNWFVEDHIQHLYPAEELRIHVLKPFDYAWYF